MRSEALRRVLGWLAAVALVGGAAVLAVRLSGRPPDGPVDVVWDATRCARCRMLVSESAFAAQLHTPDGRVLHFDDPGCLLLYRAESGRPVHAVWFHHHREPRWVPAARVVFRLLEGEPTPMGYGLAAYERGEVRGLSPDEALDRARRAEARRGAPGSRP